MIYKIEKHLACINIIIKYLLISIHIRTITPYNDNQRVSRTIKLIGQYCRDYRVKNNITLKELGGEDQVKNLSAFESGRSTNMHHLLRYIQLSYLLNDQHNFIKGLKDILDNGIR